MGAWLFNVGFECNFVGISRIKEIEGIRGAVRY